jgi:hypothetical protein
MAPIKTIALAVSLALNALCVALFVMAAGTGTAAVSFSSPGGRHITSALVVSVPDDGAVVFNPAEIELRPGGRAALQLSAIAEGRQANWLLNVLYDHRVLAVEPTGYGIRITAVSAGRTTMQIVTAGGVRDVALVTVVE